MMAARMRDRAMLFPAGSSATVLQGYWVNEENSRTTSQIINQSPSHPCKLMIETENDRVGKYLPGCRIDTTGEHLVQF